MQHITIQYGVGDIVWLWDPTIGREPVQMEVNGVTVRLDERWDDPQINYSFVRRDDVRLVRGQVEEQYVFSSLIEALAYREDYLEAFYERVYYQ